MSNWLYDLITWCVREGHEDVENWVAYSRGHHGASHSAESRDRLAQRVVYQQSQLAAHATVTPAAVSSMPGLRGVIRDGLIGPDVGFLVYRMVKSIMYQAAVYGHDADGDLLERALLTLGLALGEAQTRRALVEGGERAPGKIIAAITGRGGSEAYAERLSSEIVGRFRGRGLLQDVPIVGRSFFGVQNFVFISAASLAGRYVFNDLMLTADELAELDRRVVEWSRTVVGLMMWMARADGNVDGREAETIEALKRSVVMPGMHAEDLNGEMNQKPDWERIRKQFRTDDERAGLLENVLLVTWADGVKTKQEDRLCRRLAAELVADRMVDDIEAAVRQSLGLSGPGRIDEDTP